MPPQAKGQRKARDAAERITVRSLDNDSCLWLSYEIAVERLEKLNIPASENALDPYGIKSQYIEITHRFLNEGSLQGLALEDPVKKNLEEILTEHYQYFVKNPTRPLIFISGSNRACLVKDLNNSMEKPGKPGEGREASTSGVHNLVNIAQYYQRINPNLSAPTVSKFLLADLYFNRSIGGTATQIQSKLDVNGRYQQSETTTRPSPEERDLEAALSRDPHKIILLFAQMQSLANEHPDSLIDFEFYDDDAEILSTLQHHYSGNTNLIPSNIRLYLYQKDNTEKQPSFQQQNPISGTGLINEQWQPHCRTAIQLLMDRVKAEENVESDAPKRPTCKEENQLNINILRALQGSLQLSKLPIVDPTHAIRNLRNCEQQELTAHMTASQARIAELKALQRTVQARNPRGAWRSWDAWVDWGTRQSLYNTFSPKAWSDWWQGKHNTEKKDKPIGLSPFESRIITSNSMGHTIRYGAVLPFLSSSWPTKAQVLSCIENDLILATAQQEKLEKEQRALNLRHLALSNGSTQEFMGNPTEGFTDDFDLAGQRYIVNKDDSSRCQEPISRSRSYDSIATAMSDDEIDSETLSIKSFETVHLTATSLSTMHLITTQSDRFGEWLKDGYEGKNKDQLNKAVDAFTTTETQKYQDTRTRLNNIQDTLDHQLVFHIRVLEALYENPRLNEAQQKHLYAQVRDQLIKSLRAEIQHALINSYHYQALNTNRLHAKLHKIHNHIPHWVLAVLARETLKFAEFKVQISEQSIQQALKAKAPQLYQAVKTAQKAFTPTQSTGNALASFGSLFGALNPLNWGTKYQGVPQAA